jgi:hypothetical protein
MGSEKFGNSAKSGYNKGTIRSDIWYLAVSKDVRRHRLISISYISHGRGHGRGREFESGRPRHHSKEVKNRWRFPHRCKKLHLFPSSSSLLPISPRISVCLRRCI